MIRICWYISTKIFFCCIKRAEKWDYRALRRKTKLVSSSEHIRWPEGKRPRMITNILYSCYLVHDLFKIYHWTVIEFFYHDIWHWHMTWISEMPFSCSVFHIDETCEPIIIPDTIPIDTSLHTHEIVCLRTEEAHRCCTILSTCSQIHESQWHICYSWINTISSNIDVYIYEVRAGRESLTDSISFRSIGGTEGEEHNYPSSKQIIAAIPRKIPVISILERTSPNFQ